MAKRVVHYLNQFFAGMGGEDKAHLAPSVLSGPTGPGKLLQARMGPDYLIVATVYCGDTFFADHIDEALPAALALIEAQQPDVVVLGPAFNAGRYGIACAEVGSAVVQRLGIPAVSGFYPENPSIEKARRHCYVVPTGDSAAEMPRVMPKIATIAAKAAQGEPLFPEEDGLLTHNTRKNVIASRSGAERAVQLLLSKLAGEVWTTETPLPEYETVPVPPPVPDLSRATVALVTEGGIVPKGNPDGLQSARAQNWFKYPVDGLVDLHANQFESIHSGYDSSYAKQDPDRVLPLDAARALEREGKIAKLHDWIYTTTGNVTTIENATRFGREIAADLKQNQVQAVIFTAT